MNQSCDVVARGDCHSALSYHRYAGVENLVSLLNTQLQGVELYLASNECVIEGTLITFSGPM